MNKEIFYTVETLFWRKKIGDKLKFIFKGGNIKDAVQHTSKEFRDKSPIVARSMAFSHFQSIVDVLYEAIGKEYKNDKQARIDLQVYFNSGNNYEFRNTETGKFIIGEDFLNGITVYLNMKDEKEGMSRKIQIHSINYLDDTDQLDEEVLHSLDGLIEECKMYEENVLSVYQSFKFLNLESLGRGFESVLATPFKWDPYLEKIAY